VPQRNPDRRRSPAVRPVGPAVDDHRTLMVRRDRREKRKNRQTTA
jgi:hypothetical protein